MHVELGADQQADGGAEPCVRLQHLPPGAGAGQVLGLVHCGAPQY